MTTFNKIVLAAAIAMIVSSAAYAGEIQKGTTGYAAQVVNGQEFVLAQTYKLGEMPTESALVKVLPPTDMPDEYQTLNQDSVGKVQFDTTTLVTLKKGDIAKFDYLGVPKDGKVIDTISHDNGDHSMITANGAGERTVLTFGSDGSVVGTATVDGRNSQSLPMRMVVPG
jgi:hypothetical protein